MRKIEALLLDPEDTELSGSGERRLTREATDAMRQSELVILNGHVVKHRCTLSNPLCLDLKSALRRI